MTIIVETPFEINAFSPQNGMSLAQLTSTKAVAVYTNGPNGGGGGADEARAVIVENDESVGSSVQYSSGSSTTRTFVVALSATKALAVYCSGGGTTAARFRVLSISGTTITTPGAILVSSFSVDPGSRAIALVNLTSTNSLFVYTASGTTKAVIISVSGTTVTEESGGALSAWGVGNWDVIDLCALSSTKVLACQDQTASSNRGVTTVLNISGVNVTDGGVDTVFETGHTNAISVTEVSSTAAIVTYSDNGDSDFGKAQIITVSGSTPTSNTSLPYQSNAVDGTAVAVFDSTHAVVISSNADVVTELNISGTTITKGNEDSITTSNDLVRAVAFSASEALVSFEGSFDGAIVSLSAATHIWLSIDGGATYTDIGDSAWAANVVGGVVVVPGTAYQTIFADVGTSLYKTVNGGAAWTLETAIGYEADFLELEKDNTTVFMSNRAAGGNRASLWDSVGASLSHLNTGKSTTGGSTAGGDVV